MLKITLFPRLAESPEQHSNPYIRDFVAALEACEGVQVVNPARRNPLLSILLPRHWGDVFVFNWFESLPEFKYGWLQSLAGIWLVCMLRLTGRKVVWVLHNRENHTGRHRRLTHLLRRFIARFSTLIITHATDGVRIVQEQYPYAAGRTHFVHHPTKDRLDMAPVVAAPAYDLLLWGHISRYKGVLEFVRFLHTAEGAGLRVCIAGRCASPALRAELEAQLPPEVKYIARSVTFEELGALVAQSRFVLTPYSAQSVLSSGALMDSLSFGARVIGPDTGSFRDYAGEPLLSVSTFRTFDDIPRIVRGTAGRAADRENYARFLHENDWNHFAATLLRLLGAGPADRSDTHTS